MTALRLIAAPTVEPISLAEAKLHLRVDSNAEDTLITEQIKVARQQVENILQRALVTQTWELVMDKFPNSTTIKIPLPPLQSVSSITYIDQDGASTVYSSVSYLVDTYNQPGRIRLRLNLSWPSVYLQELNAVRIQFVAGYGAAAAVPEWAKAAIKLLLGDLYENREQTLVAPGIVMANLPTGVMDLLWPHRVVNF
jgi:uncharacterized phiE125 gp8 family phage protein